MPKIPEISVGIQMLKLFGFFRPEYSGSPLEPRPSNPHGLTVRLAVWDANLRSHGFASQSHGESVSLKLSKTSGRYEGISRNLCS